MEGLIHRVEPASCDANSWKIYEVRSRISRVWCGESAEKFRSVYGASVQFD